MNCPARMIRVPKKEKRQIDFLTREQVANFIREVSMPRRGYAEVNRLRNVAIVMVLFSSGIRVSELCRLNRDSIKNRQFSVVGKSKTPRVVFVSSETERAIEKYLIYRGKDSESALFISNENGKRITCDGVRRIFRNVCARSNEFENVHPHTLRHSFATALLKEEIDIFYIGQLLGHESLDTTRQYLHYENPTLQKIYKKAFD